MRAPVESARDWWLRHYSRDREETASRVYSVRRHRRARMLELAVGWTSR